MPSNLCLRLCRPSSKQLLVFNTINTSP
uniref:Uncharacterized protein n=1 Tax=Rhizophora mucronata TaxID=61149 RepID=A0A2P2R1C0_RHIMU